MIIYDSPLKIHGKKRRLVGWILELLEGIEFDETVRWIEPFMGSGVVGFNVKPKIGLFGDKNPYIINFFNQIKDRVITSDKVREFLKEEGEKLRKGGKQYYYEVRNRFNKNHNPFDFLFLNKTCFNGIIRFNRRDEFNASYNQNSNKFSDKYIEKIVEQIKYIEENMRKNDWNFITQDFRETILEATENDVIYCDPSYIGRYGNYYKNDWTEKDEYDLFELLKNFKGRFILSTWYETKQQKNEFVEKLWSKHFKIITINHRYFHAGNQNQRNSVIEGLVLNFDF